MLHSMSHTGIVVPCYNEAQRLPVADFESFLDRHPDMAFCFVNDGSTDGTAEVLHGLAAERGSQVSVIEQTANTGKAEAVRTGILHLASSGAFRFIGYWDADLATPLDELELFLETATVYPHVRFLCGSRIRKMGAAITRHTYRHYLGRLFATAASLVLGLDVYDTQCGAKLIDTRLARDVFRDPFISPWLFDVEVLARIRKLLGKETTERVVFEVPLRRWEDKRGTNLKVVSFVKAPWELFRIFIRYRGQGD